MELPKLLDRLVASTTTARAFGAPIEAGGVTVIPVAIVFGAGGVGGAEVPPEGLPQPLVPPSKDDDGPPTLIPGLGGGYGALSWPLGAYVVKDGDVRWMPAVDVTRIVLAVIAIAKLTLRLRRHALKARA